MDALPSPNPLRIDAATQAVGLASAFTMPADQVLHQFFRARRELGPLESRPEPHEDSRPSGDTF